MLLGIWSLFIIFSFLHGGAWRSQTQDKKELEPALSQLLELANTETLGKIAGFASVNYGLSCYAPDDESQDLSLRVQHPTHITDVVLALAFLRDNYDVGTLPDKDHPKGGYDYIVVGHSAGATLAFQALLHHCDCAAYKPPVAIVGLAGIYSLPLLLDNHTDEPYYKLFVDAAFSTSAGPPSVKTLESASPVNGEYGDVWKEGGLRCVVLAGSDVEDVLVEKEQWMAMSGTLEGQGWKVVGDTAEKGEGAKKEIVVLPLEGTHNEIWELGVGVRRGIEAAIGSLFPN